MTQRCIERMTDSQLLRRRGSVLAIVKCGCIRGRPTGPPRRVHRGMLLPETMAVCRTVCTIGYKFSLVEIGAFEGPMRAAEPVGVTPTNRETRGSGPFWQRIVTDCVTKQQSCQ
jgi:hypothetical protein